MNQQFRQPRIFRNAAAPTRYTKKATREGTVNDLFFFLGWVLGLFALICLTILLGLTFIDSMVDNVSWPLGKQFHASLTFASIIATGFGLWMTRQAWKKLRILRIFEQVRTSGMPMQDDERPRGGLLSVQYTEANHRVILHDVCTTDSTWIDFCISVIRERDLSHRRWDAYFGPADNGARRWPAVVRPKLVQAKLIEPKSEKGRTSGYVLTGMGERAFLSWANQSGPKLIEHHGEEETVYEQ